MEKYFTHRFQTKIDQNKKLNIELSKIDSYSHIVKQHNM